MVYIFKANYMNEEILSYKKAKDKSELVKKLEKKEYQNIDIFERKLKFSAEIPKRLLLKFIVDFIEIIKSNKKISDEIAKLKYENENLMILIYEVFELYDKGLYLYECFSLYKDILPSFLIEMTKTAELSGNLAEGLEVFSESFLTEATIEENLLEKFKNPKLLLILIISLLIFSFFMGVENLKSLFYTLKMDEPLVIKQFFRLHNFLSSKKVAILIVFHFCIFSFYFFKKTLAYAEIKKHLQMKMYKKTCKAKTLRYINFIDENGLEAYEILDNNFAENALENKVELAKELEACFVEKYNKKIKILEQLLIVLLLIIIIILAFSSMVSLKLFFSI